ncbi:MAG: efflux RND transporter periplasmic adaptor subunit [Alphaproteobacteria bacterium]
MLRAIVSFVVVVVFVALFGGAYWAFVADATTDGAGDMAAGGWATPVEVAEVTVKDSERSVFAVGTLVAGKSVIVRSEVGGRVAKLDLPEGQPVKAGHVLVQLDPSVEEAELQVARARLELAQANHTRANELLKRGTGTQRALDEARAELKAVQAAAALREAEIEKLTIHAPFDGVLGIKRIDEGDYLAPGAEIINIEQIDPLLVEFRVPEIFLPAVSVGKKVLLSIDAYPDRTFEGEVYAIDPLIDTAGRSIVMRARVPNAEGALRPGLFARVSLTLTVNQNAIFVPEEAIVPIGENRFLFRVVDGKAAFTPVKTGLRGGGMVEIVEGLAPSDVVITAGVLKIYDGAAVQPVPPAPAVSPEASAAGAAPAAPEPEPEPEAAEPAPQAGG